MGMNKSIILFTAFLFLISCRRGDEGEAMVINVLPSVDFGSDFPADREIVFSAVVGDFSGRTRTLFTEETFRNTGERFWQGTTVWPEHGNLSLLGYSGQGVENVRWNEEDPTSSVEMDVPDNSSNQEDILIGCVDDNPRMPWIEMKMQHVFSLLTFSVQSDIDFDPDLNLGVSISGISIADVALGGHLTVSREGSGLDVVWTEVTGSTTRVIDGVSDIRLNSFETANVGVPLLILPSGRKTVTVTYRIHNGFDGLGRPVNVDIECNVSPQDNWLAGYCTNYLIRITAKELTLTPRIVPWESVWYNVEL